MKIAIDQYDHFVGREHDILFVFYNLHQNEVYILEQDELNSPLKNQCHEALWVEGGIELRSSSDWCNSYPRVSSWFENGDLRRSTIAFSTLLGLVAAAAE